MNETINKIPLTEESINGFFLSALESGRPSEDCLKLISDLLQRCCNENQLDKLYPVISNIAQHVNERISPRAYETPIIQSIH